MFSKNLYIPHSSYKTIIIKSVTKKKKILYIPHSSYKTVQYIINKIIDKYFTSHIVHIKQFLQKFTSSPGRDFTSHIVHIKREPVAREFEDDETTLHPT